MSIGTIATTHPQYNAFMEKWKLIRAVMRSDCKSYLRDLTINESDKAYGKQRQDEYEKGAILYNFSRRTRDGMKGGIFRKSPEIVLPDGLAYLLDDADGNGVGLIQQSKDQVQENIEVSRAGLLVDMPSSTGMSKKDQNNGMLNAKILPYTTEAIINWRVKRIGAINKLIWIVLSEPYEYTASDNEFELKVGRQFRLLELVDGVYQQRVWRYDVSDVDVTEDGHVNGEVIEVKANGKSLDYIPFYFIGGQNNDHTIDDPVMEPICELNIGHYRNSADNEESSFVVGQPTLFIAPGENINAEQWLALNPDGIKFGSRRGHNIGAGGTAMLVQAEANNLAKQNMLDKEDQAVKIGAQLISPTQNVTDESARTQRSADNSVLATIGQNVSSAYQKAITACGEFMGVTGEIKFVLSNEFFDSIMTAQDRAAWLADINMGVMPVTDYWEAMRKSNLTTKTDEELQKEYDANEGL